MAEWTAGKGTTALGIIGTALGGLAASGANLGILGGNVACENMPVTRYEMSLEQKNAELTSQLALRDANIYNDQKMLEFYKYVDGRFNGIEGQIAQQAVVNAQITANIGCMQNTIATLSGLTKTVVPIDNVCPEPMRMYNSWTAPTTAAAG